MNLIVDTNIVFSALLNPKSPSGKVLLGFDHDLKFFAPFLMPEEINRYFPKIQKYSKLSEQKLLSVRDLVLSVIHIVPENQVSPNNWIKAFDILKEVDQDDVPFLALALELNCALWTGDKKLVAGIKNTKPDMVITIKELQGI